MIVLKHLAREFKLDPHKLRKLMRENFKIPAGRRWQYDEDSKELKKIRQQLPGIITRGKKK